MLVAAHLKQPTREQCGPHLTVPLFGLAPVGFTLPALLPARGALLPHHFTLTRRQRGGIFSVALSVGSRPPGVTWHPALWSPDFPPPRPPRKTEPHDSDHPADLLASSVLVLRLVFNIEGSSSSGKNAAIDFITTNTCQSSCEPNCRFFCRFRTVRCRVLVRDSRDPPKFQSQKSK